VFPAPERLRGLGARGLALAELMADSGRYNVDCTTVSANVWRTNVLQNKVFLLMSSLIMRIARSIGTAWHRPTCALQRRGVARVDVAKE
jgi:hypothetical protein